MTRTRLKRNQFKLVVWNTDDVVTASVALFGADCRWTLVAQENKGITLERMAYRAEAWSGVAKLLVCRSERKPPNFHLASRRIRVGGGYKRIGYWNYKHNRETKEERKVRETGRELVDEWLGSWRRPAESGMNTMTYEGYTDDTHPYATGSWVVVGSDSTWHLPWGYEDCPSELEAFLHDSMPGYVVADWFEEQWSACPTEWLIALRKSVV